MTTRVLLLFGLLAMAGGAPDASAQEADGVTALLRRLEQSILSGRVADFETLVSPGASLGRAREFAAMEFDRAASKVIIQERVREALRGSPPSAGYRLVVDAFIEFGRHARVATWRLDVKTADGGWRIADEERITSVEGLYRLSIDSARQFTARNFRIAAEDLELTLVDGSVFLVNAEDGITGLILLGQGEMRFQPATATERGQVKIFCGSETLDARFDAAFIRLHPDEYERRVDSTALTARAVDPRDMRRAEELFRDESPKSFNLDLADLSRDTWSLLPAFGDFLAEVRTRRFNTLTYAHSFGEPEDISLFERKRRLNISMYPSKRKLEMRGPFYNEDDLAEYDVLDYVIDVALAPEREWIDGHARVHLRIRSPGVNAVTLRLADPLVVQSIVSDEFGRLFGIRIKGQDSLVVNLPVTMVRDSELVLTIAYGGRLEPQEPDRETAGQRRRPSRDDDSIVAAEPNYLYTNSSYWYPQALVTDYATASMRITVPAGLDCVASGDLEEGSPTTVNSAEGPHRVYQFRATQPVRYLSFIASRMARGRALAVKFADPQAAALDATLPLSGVSYDALSLGVASNPRLVSRGDEAIQRAADMVRFYESLVGDAPYPSFTLAMIESDLPGGHSPGYFAAINNPLPTTPLVWRSDPAAFSAYPDFFLAHEVAHQWWGHAVGWRNYHEQWISEGFAQYFAALYAERRRGAEVFTSVLKQMRSTAMDQSDQGPVYLGYRLGHIRNESRVFRSLVYNKSGAVLHMLRRLVGDDAFFRGVRRFYRMSRFRKAGTENFRAAMELEAGRPLGRFFEQWIYGTTLPRVKFSYRREGAELVLRAEQLGDIFEVPLTIAVEVPPARPVSITMPVTDRIVEQRVPINGTIRRVEVRTDDGTLVDIVK